MLIVKAKPNRPSGFTIIEMMITLTVLSVLLALALSWGGNWIKNAQIRTVAESLQNGLQQARNEAARRNAEVEFVLTGGSKWSIRLANAGTVLESRTDASDQVVLTRVPAEATVTTFDGQGRRKSANAAGKGSVLTRICVDLPVTVMPAAETRDLELDVSLSGAVRMCDPKVAEAADTRYCENYPTTCTGI